MSVNITYFCHGTSTDNEKHLSTGWNQGELSELGKQQALKLAEQTKDKKFDVVFCSDLKRAIETAQLAFHDRAEIIQDQRLRERNYGDLNGGDSKVVEPLQESTDYKFPNGESYEDVKVRIAEFLKFLKEKYDGKSVAIVSHKAPQIALDVLLKNSSLEQAIALDWRKTKAWQPGWEYIA